MPLALRLADPDGKFQAVRLASDLPLSHEQRSFARNGEGWRLDLDVPDILRLEYKLEVDHLDGATEHVCDPENPKRAPGAFGEKSVLELPGYEPPAWLEQEGVPGEFAEVEIRGRGLGAHVADPHLEPGERRRGPAAAAAAGQRRTGVRRALADHALRRRQDRERRPAAVPDRAAAADRPQPVVLRLGRLQPGAGARHRPRAAEPRRDRRAGGDGREPRRARDAARPPPLPAHARRAVPAVGQLLHAPLRRPRAAVQPLHADRALRPRDACATAQYAIPVPTCITVGTAEENAHNNREMARALSAQGYEVSLEEVPDLHNYVGWRDAFDPHLTTLLKRAWTR